MDIASVANKPLRRFIETGNARGVVGDVARIRNMVAYLLAISDVDELRVPPNFGAHILTGDRAGVWALTVTRNWRMTFVVDADNAIAQLDLEDYH